MQIQWLCLDRITPKDLSDNKSNTYCRDPFLIDHGAIVHSSEFRRLSNKTQVFSRPESDFVRTRLTHSIEASQIGRQLARIAIQSLPSKPGENNFEKYFEDLVVNACLAHDLGHPPFGHMGAVVLKEISGKATKHNYEFDDNKQVVRILLGTGYRSQLNVSHALVDSILKYKHKNDHCYDSERSLVEHTTKLTGTESLRHPACYLMEIADDISYIAADVEDALKFDIITTDNLIEMISPSIELLDSEYKKLAMSWADFIRENSFDPRRISSALIKACINHAAKGIKSALSGKDANELPNAFNDFVKSNGNKKDPYNLLYWNDGTTVGEELRVFKKERSQPVIFRSHYNGRMEFIANKVIHDLWNAFIPLSDKTTYANSPAFKIIPNDLQEYIQKLHKGEVYSESNAEQILCDFISGMTDRYAIRLWDQLHTPDRLIFAA